MPAKKEEARLKKMKALCNELLKEQSRRRLASEMLSKHKEVCLDLAECKRVLLSGYNTANFKKFEAAEKAYEESQAKLSVIAKAKDNGKINISVIEAEIVQEAVKLTRL